MWRHVIESTLHSENECTHATYVLASWRHLLLRLPSPIFNAPRAPAPATHHYPRNPPHGRIADVPSASGVCFCDLSLISVESSAWTLVGVWFGGGRGRAGNLEAGGRRGFPGLLLISGIPLQPVQSWQGPRLSQLTHGRATRSDPSLSTPARLRCTCNQECL